MKRSLPMTYKPAELQAMLDMLGGVICTTPRDPASIVKALFERGYRIVYTGEPKP